MYCNLSYFNCKFLVFFYTEHNYFVFLSLFNMKSFLKSFQAIAKDSTLPFRNFLHWNISKIIAMLTGYFLWIVLCLPFFILSLIYITVFFPEISLPVIITKTASMTLSSDDFSTLFNKGFITIFLSIFAFFWYFAFIFGKTYGYVLNLLISKFYLHGKKVKFKDLILIHIPTLKKYAQIFLWNTLFLSLPIIGFLIIFWIFLIIAGGVEWATSVVVTWSDWANRFTIGMGITLFISIAAFAYINFRIIFSVLLLVESDEFGNSQETPALDYLKKSVRLTSWIKKIFLFLLVFISLGVVTLPVTYTIESSAQNVKDGMRYMQLVRYASMSGVTLPESYTEELWTLSEQFKGKSGQDILDFTNRNTLLSMIFWIFSFLVINGLVEFLLYSYFFRVLLQRKKEHD